MLYSSFLVECDKPLCGNTQKVFPGAGSNDGFIQVFMKDIIEELEEDGWQVENGKHYCPECRE